MKNQFLPALMAGILVGGLSGCSMEDPWGGPAGEGAISLDFKATGQLGNSAKVRADVKEIRVPETDKFQVTLARTDGSYSKTWASIAEFKKEASFKVGHYTLSVTHGHEKSQGYDAPYMYGEADVNVSEGATTSAQITARLKNAVVEVEYTDAFKKYFSSWATTLQSQGHDYLSVDRDDDYIFIVPGRVDVTIQVVSPQGKSVKLNPGSFNVTAGCYHKVKYNINNGEVGQLDQLEVTFTEDTDEVPVTIDLTDDLYTAAPPALTPVGFASGDVVESLEGTPVAAGQYKVEAIAAGEIASARLTVESDTYSPLWGTEIDLCKATAEQQQQIAKAGIDVKGIFRNPDRMAVVDYSGFCQSLPTGRHKITLSLTDKMSRASEPVSLTFDSQALAIDAEPLGEIQFGDNVAKIRVSYNGLNPQEAFSFRANDANGVFYDAKVLSVESAATRAFESKDYEFTISVMESERNDVAVQLFYYGAKRKEMTATVALPDYEVEADAFARKAILRIVPGEGYEGKTAAITRLAKVYLDGGRVNSSDLECDDANGIITLMGLTQNHKYTVTTTLRDLKDSTNPVADKPQEFSAPVEFTTETESGVPNGDFETLTEKINKTIDQGGRWTITTTDNTGFQTTLTMNVKEPTGWLTTNAQTCNDNASNVNSWYVIPSVYNTTLSWVSHQPDAKKIGIGQSAYDSTADVYKNLTAKSGANAMVVRNVAWDANGTPISIKKQTGSPASAGYANYFCSNKPSAIANRTAGRMWLGTDAAEGASFASRPVSLKGYYKYAQDSHDTSEKGVVEVKLMAGDKVLASGSLELGPADSYTAFEVPLAYDYVFGLKATKLLVSFKSSNRESGIETTDYCNKEECCSRGAMLTVDNLTFAY